MITKKMILPIAVDTSAVCKMPSCVEAPGYLKDQEEEMILNLVTAENKVAMPIIQEA
jgi:hypothetical protein